MWVKNVHFIWISGDDAASQQTHVFLYISALTVSDTVVLLIGNKYFYFESKTLFNFFITTQKLLLVINKNTFQ